MFKKKVKLKKSNKILNSPYMLLSTIDKVLELRIVFDIELIPSNRRIIHK